MTKQMITLITDELSQCPFICGVVLGGSRATGTATEASDIDIGIYYNRSTLDYDLLNEIAAALDDEHRPNLICREGEWGAWVNCGGWLTVQNIHVDLILRDIDRVENVIRKTDEGKITPFYQTGHPHAYIDVMYRGELAVSKVLYAADEHFTALKRRAEDYSDALQKAIVDFFSFEAGFSCMLAEKSLNTGDSYYVAGHLFRSVSALNQVLFARNRQYCLNEKKAILRIDGFQHRPEQYREKVNQIFTNIGETLDASVQSLKTLCDEIL